jgi:hypothetical protein
MRGLGKPETFNVLGFTFICERNSQGKFFILRKTRRDRMQAKLKAIKEDGACTSRSLSKRLGYGRLSGASSPITPSRPTGRR